MKKSVVALMVLIGIIVGIGVVGAATAVASNGTKTAAAPPAGGESGAVAIAWNQELLNIVQTPGAQPATLHPTRSFAILQAAIYDSVVSITKEDRPYLVSVPAARGTRVDASAAQAGHDVLAALYPKWQTELHSQLATELAAIPDSTAKQAGIQVGQSVAKQLLAIRSTDGSADPTPAFVAGTQPGDFRPVPPAFAAPRLHRLGERQALRPGQRLPVSARRAAGRYQRRLCDRIERGQEPRPEHQHDAHR